MKARREFSFAISMLILAILACNMPNTTTVQEPSSESTDPTAVVSPAVTFVVVVVNTDTPTPTETPIPVTPTLQLSPKITLTKNSNCRAGPTTFYNVIDQIASGTELPVIGINEDNTWWQVINATNRECWIFNENATPNTDFRSLPIGEAPPLPGVPQSFFVVDQQCLSAQKKFSLTLSWASGGGETAYRLYRDGARVGEFKPTRLNYKDPAVPYNKVVTYELEAVNENGVSEKAIQIIPACK
ncbi:MAG TPA: SH3 domain-containing protein [Anaerolineales bacterium]|nr:SH3 domain-containing protein [Anaerolineales bacterium]HNB36378.1 SH3 domain-containing protein [Anaerolineales bacterium]HNC07768.1 SH3 domain-containing protein [Anaerolineales bacterium]